MGPEEFAKFILEEEYGYKVSRGVGYDFNAEKDNLKIAVEVKSTDISKPTGKIVIDWSQIDALMSAAKNGRKAYLFLVSTWEGEVEDFAIFGLVRCERGNAEGKVEFKINQPSELK